MRGRRKVWKYGINKFYQAFLPPDWNGTDRLNNGQKQGLSQNSRFLQYIAPILSDIGYILQNY